MFVRKEKFESILKKIDDSEEELKKLKLNQYSYAEENKALVKKLSALEGMLKKERDTNANMLQDLESSENNFETFISSKQEELSCLKEQNQLLINDLDRSEKNTKKIEDEVSLVKFLNKLKHEVFNDLPSHGDEIYGYVYNFIESCKSELLESQRVRETQSLLEEELRTSMDACVSEVEKGNALRDEVESLEKEIDLKRAELHDNKERVLLLEARSNEYDEINKKVASITPEKILIIKTVDELTRLRERLKAEEKSLRGEVEKLKKSLTARADMAKLDRENARLSNRVEMLELWLYKMKDKDSKNDASKSLPQMDREKIRRMIAETHGNDWREQK